MSNPYGSPGNPDDRNGGSSDDNGGLPSYGDYASGDPAEGYGQPQDPGNPYGAYPGGAFPEGPSQQFLGGSTLPGAGKRLGAYLIDAIIVGIVSGIISAIFVGGTYSDYLDDYSDWADNGEIGDPPGLDLSAVLLPAVVGLVLWFGYRMIMEVTKGATVGKMALKMKVVNIDGGRITYQESFLRNSWYLLSALLTAFLNTIGGIAMIVIMIILGVQISRSPQNQHICDTWGKTYVVNAY